MIYYDISKIEICHSRLHDYLYLLIFSDMKRKTSSLVIEGLKKYLSCTYAMSQKRAHTHIMLPLNQYLQVYVISKLP